MRVSQRRAIGAIAVLVGLALAFWLLFVRTPDGAKGSSTESYGRALTPTYPPEVSNSRSASDSTASTDVSTTDSSVEGSTATASEPTTTASVTDRVGDLTFSVDPPPPWADLAGATLTRSSAGFELRVRLGGGSAPTDIDGNHTMNIASFYDGDGDGVIDAEIWANLTSGGWGGAWFDDRAKTAKFDEESGVSVSVEGDAVVLRFPADHVSGDHFRWSIASEWGSFAVINTPAAARDDAPDNDQPTSFPS